MFIGWMNKYGLVCCSYVMFMSGDVWKSGGIDYIGVFLFFVLLMVVIVKIY